MTNIEAINKLEHLINSPVGREEIDETCYEVMKYLSLQEPRVITLEEAKSLKQDTVVWYEHTGINGPRPRIVHYADDRCIVFTDGGKWQYDADRYGSLWRCWTSKPTKEQMMEVKWNA